MRFQHARLVLIAFFIVVELVSVITTVAHGVVDGTKDTLKTNHSTGALVIQLFDSQILVCTATVITPRVLITAAHCVDSLSGQPLKFTLGVDAMGARELSSSVAARRAYVNPAFDLHANGLLHDIALVELEFPLENPTSERLLNPVDAVAMLHPGTRVEIVGYGRIHADGELLGTKNYAQATIASVSADEIVIGAPGDPQNCDGDSGGPAFIVESNGQKRLIGIVSRSANDATDCLDGSIHTRVDAYADWISSILRKIDEKHQYSKKERELDARVVSFSVQ